MPARRSRRPRARAHLTHRLRERRLDCEACHAELARRRARGLRAAEQRRAADARDRWKPEAIEVAADRAPGRGGLRVSRRSERRVPRPLRAGLPRLAARLALVVEAARERRLRGAEDGNVRSLARLVGGYPLAPSKRTHRSPWRITTRAIWHDSAADLAAAGTPGGGGAELSTSGVSGHLIITHARIVK